MKPFYFELLDRHFQYTQSKITYSVGRYFMNFYVSNVKFEIPKNISIPKN